jgi:hypothetical protein
MKNLFKIIIVASILLVGNVVKAQDVRGLNNEFIYNGSLLMAVLKENPAVGAAYIIGVHDATAGAAHCAPRGDIQEFTTFMVSALQVFPKEVMDSTAVTADQLITYVLSQKFPCKRV